MADKTPIEIIRASLKVVRQSSTRPKISAQMRGLLMKRRSSLMRELLRLEAKHETVPMPGLSELEDDSE